MRKLYAIIALMSTGLLAKAQMQVNAPIFIEPGAYIAVDNMDVNTTADITGGGTLILQGNTSTALNSTNNQLPSVTINKTGGTQVTFTGNPQVNGVFDFANGTGEIAASNLYINDAGSITNATSTKYLKTTGTGSLIKKSTTALTNYNLPVGTASQYAPVAVTNTCACTSAELGARAVGAAHPSKAALSADYLNVYWPITRNGTMTSASAVGTYIDPAHITGTEANLRGALYTGGAWSWAGGANNATNNTVGASITASGDLYGQSGYVLLNAKAFLMGPYTAATNIMSASLKNAPNLIPTSDPYRVAPYNAAFTHVNNPTPETTTAAVLGSTNATDAITDWVFLELRNTTTGNPGANKVKTRAALIQRDGDIVDVDGVSPVVFQGVTPGSFAVAVRHRNHLGLCTEPTGGKMFALREVATPQINMTTLPDSMLFGKADSNYRVDPVSGKNLMWAGNANSNTVVTALNLTNDKDALLTRLGQVPSNPTVSNVYDRADVNLNRNVTASGLNNDKDVILRSLNFVPGNTRRQALPQ